MTPADRPDNDYLWDRSGPVDRAIADLEARLAPLRFDPAAHPLVLPRARRRPLRAIVLAGAIAASLLAAAGAWYYHWRLDWTANRPWTVTLQSATAGQHDTVERLDVGQPLIVAAPASRARLDIARIGTIDATVGTELTVWATEAGHHRVQLTRGTIDVRVWAPPGVMALRTPAGSVIDLGCVFQLSVTGDTAHLVVRTGWVELDNAYGESLIPAGASGLMQPDARPGVALYDDATTDFKASVRAFEGAPPGDALQQVATIDAQARERDVLTLLLLAVRQSGGPRAQFVDRAAALAPPPSSVELARARTDDNDALWRWIDALPLPPVKAWWRNWRDGLPRLR